jgi:hypothetical protein
MREIEATQGYVVKVDDEDYEWLSEHNWHVFKQCATKNGLRTHVYVRTHLSMTGDDGYAWKREEMMHRMILGAKRDEFVDHINCDTLDNRRKNLRVCTRSENSKNARKMKTGPGVSCTSKYKGVHLGNNCGTKNPWRANITNDGKRITIGGFATEMSAAIAYDEAARKYHGKFAHTNFEGVV